MTFLPKLALVSVLSLLAATAQAAPVLRGNITVVDQVVTVADMFEDAGSLAERAIFGAPAPGTTGNVDLASIRAAAARLGITEFDARGLSSIQVTRAGSIVDEAMLKDLMLADLTARGFGGPGVKTNIQFSTFVDPVQVSANGASVRLEGLRYGVGSRDFTARFAIAGQSRMLEVAGTIDMTVEMPHLAGNYAAGTILMPQHVVMRPLPVSQADAFGMVPLEQLVGMALNRQSREGMLLRASDVSPPLTVAKNDLVTIVYRRGPMTLTVKGQAVTSASTGNTLQVLNLMSKRIISATAIAPGTVEVTSSPMSLAGL